MNKEEQRGLRLRTKVFLGLALCAVLAAALFGAFLLGASRQKGAGEPVITGTTLGEQLKAVQELVSVEYYYTNMGKFEDQIDFYGWKVPFTTKVFIVSYDGIIKAGVDLSRVDVVVDEAAQTVEVSLPEGTILSHEILEDSIEVFDESKNIFNQISISDYTGFTSDQKGTMEQKAIERGLLSSAEEKAYDAVQSFLSLLPGMEEYTLTVHIS